MKIGIASTGRSLDENVYKRFANSPAYLIYDTSDKSVRPINNFAKYQDGCGPQAAHLLIDNKIKAAIIGDIDDKSLKVLKDGNIDIYSGYPGMGKDALQKLDEGKLAKINESCRASQQAELIIEDSTNIAAKQENKIKNFKFLDLEQTFNGEFMPIDGWCMLLRQQAAGEIPSNWIEPYNFADGIYHLRLEVLEMKKRTEKPIEFEFGWCNLPEEKHLNIPHRCNFGIYSSFTTPGIYEHIAKIKDMENTSVDGREEPWDWKAGYDSPFTLVKIYGQDAYPIKIKCIVNIYSV